MVGGLDREGAGEDVYICARITVFMVDAPQPADLIVPGATGEVIAGLAADDQVIANTAIGHKPYGRDLPLVRPGKECAGFDDVVPRICVGICQREDPLIVLVLSVRDASEGIERLRAELVAEYIRRMAAVPHAVLRCIAEDDER